MYKFNYVTKSRDGKMTGVVFSAFFRHAMMQRSITSVGTANDNTSIDFNLSDGAYVRFLLHEDSAEVVYYSPQS